MKCFFLISGLLLLTSCSSNDSKVFDKQRENHKDWIIDEGCDVIDNPEISGEDIIDARYTEDLYIEVFENKVLAAEKGEEWLAKGIYNNDPVDRYAVMCICKANGQVFGYGLILLFEEIPLKK